MRYLKYASLGALTLLVLILVWGVLIEPHLIDVQEEVALIPRLPAAWQGQRVALIADLQVGMWLGNTDTIRRIVTRVIEENPSLMLIAGDFVYHPSEDEPEDVEREDFRAFDDEINAAVDLVRPLVAAGIPVYAVLGNHDYGMPWPASIKNQPLARHLRNSLEAAGVHVLQNEAAPLPAPGDRRASATENTEPPLYLIGLAPLYADNRTAKDAVTTALKQVPAHAPRLAMMHNPDSFAPFPAGTAPLAVAGHTHGGQVRVPFTPDWSLMTLFSNDQVTIAGWIDGYGQPGNHLYVNRGIGFSVVPVRLACLPELTLFTLRASR